MAADVRPTPTERCNVRLLASARRPAATPVERLVVSIVGREGVMPLGVVAGRVAQQLYRDAIRGGAWLWDIGLLGEGAFVGEVVNELEAADGVLWALDPTPASGAA